MTIIDVEAHFYTKEYQEYLLSRKRPPREEIRDGHLRLWYAPDIWEPHGPGIEDRLLNTGKNRIEIMDRAGIDMQVLSLSTPGCEQFSAAEGTYFAKKTNEALFLITNKHPNRFAGLAALAPQRPEEAAKELERTVNEFGFKGAKINSHVGDEYLDNEKFWPIFEAAEKLDVPILVHPNIPTSLMLEAYKDYGFALAGPTWGFGAEGALGVMRLLYSGVFDRYPRLKIVLGHLGEGLAFWIYRIDFSFKKYWMSEEIHIKAKKAPSEYLRNNFYICNSGMYSVPSFLCAFFELGPDHMMFGGDYPYENSDEAVKFIENVPISVADREKIRHSVAEKVFKLPSRG